MWTQRTQSDEGVKAIPFVPSVDGVRLCNEIVLLWRENDG